MKVHKLRTGIWLVLISLLVGVVPSWFIAGYLRRDLMFTAVLAVVVAAWGELSDADRAAILEIVTQSSKETDS